MKGKALASKTFKGLLKGSYTGNEKVDDFELDKSISSGTSKVYRNPKTGQVVVSHRGTKGTSDWLNNAVYGLFGKTGYKMTPRFKEAEEVQKKAQEKYGAKNISTIGHSQGGLQAELLGEDTREILTLNKATRPFDSQAGKNQFDVRAKTDLISALNPFAKKTGKEIEYESSSNPFTAHRVESVAEDDTMIGQGIKNPWIKHVKKYQKKHGCSYKEAMKQSKATY
jgi:hypothetical protein